MRHLKAECLVLYRMAGLVRTGCGSYLPQVAPAGRRNDRRSAVAQRRRPIVGGNWKMNTDLASAVELAEDIAAGMRDVVTRCDVAVFPPFPYLQAVGKAL